MKKSVLFLSLILISAALLFAAGFNSEIISPGGEKQISVRANRFLLIRTFTQEGGATRGVVTVNMAGQTANVLAASVIDPSNPTPGELDVINSIVIAGPAIVSATCPADATSCFLTFRNETE